MIKKEGAGEGELYGGKGKEEEKRRGKEDEGWKSRVGERE